MADRRMLSKSIVCSDAFCEMPLTTQALYFQLSMYGDDDGVVNSPRKIARSIGAADDDLKLLAVKGFIIPFDSGVVVIKHWKINNYIQKDRYKPSLYADEMKCLDVKDNGAYRLLDTVCIQNGYEVDTDCIHSVYRMDTQSSIGKYSVGKYSVAEVGDGYGGDSEKTEAVENSVENSEKLKAFGGLGRNIVMLTDSQTEALLNELGVEAFNEYVERLADFIERKGAKVHSHYDTIRKWYREDARCQST